MIEQNVKPKRDLTGNRPLDEALLTSLTSYEVSFSLLPLPAKSKDAKQASKPNRQQHPFGKGKTGKNQIRSKGGGPYSKGKGKSKWEPRLPAKFRELGGTPETPTGVKICFDYSLHVCEAAADGSECHKGAHVCAKCYGPHALKDHGKS